MKPSYMFNPVLDQQVTMLPSDTEAEMWAKLKRYHRDYQEMLKKDEESRRGSSFIERTDGRRSITYSDDLAVVFDMQEDAAVKRIIRYNLSFVTKRLIHALGKKHQGKAARIINLLDIIVNKMTEAYDPEGRTHPPGAPSIITATLSAFLPQHDIKVISLLQLPAHILRNDATVATLNQVRNWVDNLPRRSDHLFEQWHRCPSASKHYTTRFLLYTLATFKIISSGCNMFTSSSALGALFQYTEGGANLFSTALTRAPKMLKFDRVTWTEPAIKRYLGSPNIEPDITQQPNVTASAFSPNRWQNSHLPKLAMLISAPGILWDAIISKKGWLLFVDFLTQSLPEIKPYQTILQSLSWAILPAALLSSLVFQWYPVKKNCHKILSRQDYSKAQLFSALLLIGTSSLATVFQFWKLADKSKKDFFSPTVFWACAGGKFSLATFGQLGKLIDAVLKRPTRRRWKICHNTPNLFKLSCESLALWCIAGVLVLDMLLSAVITFDGTNQFSKKHLSTSEYMKAFSATIALTQVLVNLCFVVIPTSRKHAEKGLKYRAYEALLNNETRGTMPAFADLSASKISETSEDCDEQYALLSGGDSGATPYNRAP